MPCLGTTCWAAWEEGKAQKGEQLIPGLLEAASTSPLVSGQGRALSGVEKVTAQVWRMTFEIAEADI